MLNDINSTGLSWAFAALSGMLVQYYFAYNIVVITQYVMHMLPYLQKEVL